MRFDDLMSLGTARKFSFYSVESSTAIFIPLFFFSLFISVVVTTVLVKYIILYIINPLTGPPVTSHHTTYLFE